ncbi:MAG: zinc metallopeptidase [Paludibacteraceae bacterium]|nr:zinc metallopeptidase [Bacteroidales bacterium]MCQ2331107.1 zinc metallopeptidase [Paludibacteraceae bacterium]
MYWIIFITFAVLSWVISQGLENKFKKYSQVGISMTGKEVAEKMLRDHGITDVKVTCVQGHLTDHFNPETKTVNLSESVYASASIAAAAVAAHECGHAVQHQVEYAPLKMRTALVPVVNFANRWIMWVLLAGMIFFESFPQLLTIGIALYAMTTLFAFVTLPVEVNASQRAVEWLEESGIADRETKEMASDALHSAAYTYVVAALGSLAYLMYLILGSRR